MTVREVLGPDEVAAYRRDGYVVPRYRLSAERLDRLQALTRKLLADNAHLGDTPMVCPHVPGGGVQGLKGDRAWLNVSADPDIVDMVAQLVGPDVILWGTTLFYKPPAKGRRVPFHRDGRYWPIEPLATTSVWIAIEDSLPDNGCLRVIPGSHLAREVGHHETVDVPENAIAETLDPAAYDAADAVDVALEAGQMVLFDVYTIHGSNPNPSGRRRIGYAMRYMPSTSHYVHAAAERTEFSSNAHNTRPLFLLRGVDRCGLNDFTIGHPAAAAE